MSNRRSMLASEEGATPGSPLRRSTRIANSPAPAAAAPAPAAASVSRRRSSAAESSVSTPAKISRAKRTSLSHEITLEERPQTPTKKTAAKTSRAASKSPSAEPEAKEVGTPAKRGRRPSITKIKEDEAAAAKPATPSRRRSVRASVSPSNDAAPEPAAPKPRGRRASITQASLEVIKETEAKPEPKKVTRPVRTTRRMSVEAADEPEAKKDEKKPATRRSIRGRSASVDIPEEPEPEAKPTPELIPINEEEPDVEEKQAEEALAMKQAEETPATKEAEEVKIAEDVTEEAAETVDDKPDETEKPKDKEPEVIEVVDDADDAEVAEANREKADAAMVVEEARTPPPSKAQDGPDAKISSPSPRARKSLGAESDSVFKSPVVRRSPRLSTSSMQCSPEKKSSPQKSPLADVGDKQPEDTKPETPVKSPAVTTASPRRSPRHSDSAEELDLELTVETSTRKSVRLSESQSSIDDAPQDKETSFSEQEAAKEKTATPRKSSVSESVQAVQETSDASVETADDIEEKAEKKEEVENVETRRSKRLSESLDASKGTGAKEKRKSSSFSESDAKKSVALRLSKSFGENSVLNTSKTENVDAKTPSKDAKRDSILKRTPELVSGSDGSFHLNLSIPTTNSMDVDEDDDENKPDATLNLSGGSTNSDKENKASKLNTMRSPMHKRVSLSETSTPKLNNSIKMQSFCEPIEVEFSTDVVVATAQVASKAPVSVEKVAAKGLTTSQNQSIIEVDNEDEFGTSPVKALKPAAKNATKDEEEMEEELMNSFVDEVIDLEAEEDDKAAATVGDKDKSVAEMNEASEKDGKKSKAEEEIKEEETSLEKDETSAVDDAQAKETEADDNNEDAETVDVDAEEADDNNEDEETVDVDAEEADDNNEDEEADKPVIKVEEADKPVTKVEGGSKRRKVIKDEISKELDDLINAKLMEASEGSDEEDDDYNPKNEFVDDMASEGEEDTPSEDSNQIVDEGESLHSSESEGLDDDDDYENDSFITDGECDELLSGNEYDLEELEDAKSKPEKKRKSRIIRIVDSSDDEEAVAKPEPKQKSPVKRAKAEKDEEQQPKEAVVQAEPMKKSPVKKAKEQQPEEAVVQEEPKKKTPVKKAKEQQPEEDVKADAKRKTPAKKAKDEEVAKEKEPEEETAMSVKVDKSVQKDGRLSGGNKIIVLQNIKLSPPKEAQETPVVINEEDNLKSLESMKETLNPIVPRDPKPSLSTPNNSMIESPCHKTRRRTSINIQDQIKINRYSDVEISDKITKAVDFFVSSIKEKSGNVSVNVSLDYANNSSAEEGSPKKSRISLKSEDVEEINSAVDEILETTVSEILNNTNSRTKQKKRRSIASQNTSVRDVFDVEDTLDEEIPTSSKKSRAKHVEEAEVKAKGAKKRLSSKNLSFTQETENDAKEDVRTSPASKEDLPRKKQKLNKSLGDLDLVPEAKTKKAKKQRRSSVNKSLDSAALEVDAVDVEEEPEVKLSPPKKKSKKAKAAIVEPTATSVANDPEIRIQVEVNPCTTKSEVSAASMSEGIRMKFKKIKPSRNNFDNDGWNIEEARAAKPSKRNKDKKVPVKEQIEKLKKKLHPNDFKNQMIYGSNVKRMDSKDIVKNKQRAGHSKRK